MEVGFCEVCDEVLYSYQSMHCKTCDAHIHDYCQRECEFCRTRGCKNCITKRDKMNGCYICEICLSNRKYIIELVEYSTFIPSYRYDGKRETDDDIILEYLSNDLPKIKIHIDKGLK